MTVLSKTISSVIDVTKLIFSHREGKVRHVSDTGNRTVSGGCGPYFDLKEKEERRRAS